MCRRSHAHHHRHWHGRRGHRSGQASWQPLVNVLELDDSYELYMYAPELKREDFSIELVDRILTISVEKQKEEQAQDGHWMRREYRPGGFERSFELNEKIDLEKIKASYEGGVLKLSCPKYPDQVRQRRDVDIV